VNGKEIEFAFSRIDENYLTALQIPLAKGRNFSKDFPADAENSIIVNEAFVREAGWKEPIGKKVFNVNANKQNLTVVGVVKDYHFLSLREKIQPQLFRLGSGDLWVKIKPGHIAHSLQAIEKAYRQVVPFRPFEYEFMDLVNERLYEQEAKWKQMITAGTLLTLFISCIGLFGLTILSAQRRTKEIGIRKVFGASAAQIVSIFSLDFLKLILLAILLASPVAWYAANQWLQSFAYQITISPWMFLLAGALAIVVAFATMSFQALKAALANPVKSLRNE
jgi:putative ABC transport system permease protein